MTKKAEDPARDEPIADVSDPFARTIDPLNEPNAPSTQATAERPVAEAHGAAIGRFRLLEKIGEGGFGAVFVAEQKHPIKRRVALKIIKLGMDTKEVIARFEAERQALAMMDHPNIAKVFDAGATDTGRPYFAMELVRGIPITEYCDQNNCPPVQRLKLFIDVCHAIQHAHQKGVIHRDIKPSNILVTMHDGVPVPKVIDFGIAKATQGELTDKTVYTQFQQFVGTPAYMSPEQAEMSALDVDTRSDIYSLGVLLYELLTGSTPFDARELMKAGMDEMRRQIRQTEPERPSHRLSGMTGANSTETAKRRGMESSRLISLLRGDLDWVVMKCLEKDRTRRYETANALAMDVQRHLDNEPISARPPSTFYRLQKSLRRNKLGFGAAAAVLLAILAGLGLATVGFFRANTERHRAEAALAESQQQKKLADDNFREARAAVEDLLRISDERLRDQPGLQPLRLELMKAAIERYEPFLAKPIADPTPRAELARLYARHGIELLQQTEVFDQTVMAEFEKAAKLQEQLLLEHPGDCLLSSNLGWTCILEEWRPHQFEPSPERAGRRALAIFRSLVAEYPTDPFYRDDLVWALWRLSGSVDVAEGSALANEAVDIGEQLVKEYPASAEFRRELANALNIKSSRMLGKHPTPQLAAEAMPFRLRCLELNQATMLDLKAKRPEALLPERPEGDEGRIFLESNGLMWAEFDMARHSSNVGGLYRVQSDWRHAAEFEEQAVSYFKSLVEHNPTVATFSDQLDAEFYHRLETAQREEHPQRIAECAQDAIAFWNRQIELHPDVPGLKGCLQDAVEMDADIVKRITQESTTQPASRP